MKQMQYPEMKNDAVLKNINDKKTTKMLDKLIFEKTTGLGLVTRTLSNMPEDAHLFVTKKFYVFAITDFYSNKNSQR